MASSGAFGDEFLHWTACYWMRDHLMQRLTRLWKLTTSAMMHSSCWAADVRHSSLAILGNIWRPWWSLVGAATSKFYFLHNVNVYMAGIYTFLLKKMDPFPLSRLLQIASLGLHSIVRCGKKELSLLGLNKGFVCNYAHVDCSITNHGSSASGKQ